MTKMRAPIFENLPGPSAILLLFLWTCSSLAGTAEKPVALTWPKKIAELGHPCMNAAAEQALRWKAKIDSDWAGIPTASKNRFSYWISTDTFGDRVIVELLKPSKSNDSSPLFLTRETANGTLTQISWDAKSCQPKAEIAMNAGATESRTDEFTDADLTELIQKNKTGILYLWSPHMALSGKMVPEIQAAARHFGLPVAYALDPVADGAEATEWKTELKLSDSALKRVHSSELSNRGAIEHFPTVLMFRDGQLCKQQQRGFRDQAELKIILSEIFKSCAPTSRSTASSLSTPHRNGGAK